jgi:tRNA threonylcarbamoyladenosine biosynthesis protein TsaE
MIHTVITDNPDQTRQLGERWAAEVGPGWVIGLQGDLGAGKTELVKGLARGLQIQTRVQSPTFGLVYEYPGGRWPLYHLDLYRLDGEAQIRTAGLDQYFYQRTGVSVIEWVDRWAELLPEARAELAVHYRHVVMEQTSEFQRQIQYEDFGS